MTSRRLRFFALPDELIGRLGAADRAWVVPYKNGKLSDPFPAEEAAKRLHRVRMVFLAREEPPAAAIAADPAPAKWGWVELEFPRLDGNTLLLSELASRSDWSEDGFRQADPAAHDGFRYWSSLIRPLLLKHPMSVRNTVTGAEARSFERISTGALAHARAGGLLRQEGVLNLEFLPRAD